MYNEQLKTQFIREYTKSLSMADACVSAFNAAEPFEVQWDADLCTRSTEELQPVVEQLVGFRVKSKWLRIVILKDYVKWCIANGVAGACDGIMKIENVGLSKVKTQMVANPTHLQKYLNEICEPESEETTDNIYRCFYWMAYGGIPEEDILKVKCSDVDFENMVIRYGTEEVTIYREAIPAFKNATRLTEFVFKHPNYPPDKIVRRNRAPGDTVIRGIRSVPSTMALRTELSRRSKKNLEDGNTEMKLSYYRVWLSGLFYRMYERERAGLPIDFTGAASRFMEGRTYKLDSGRNTPEAKKRAITNDYMQDYQRWKAAFAI